MPLLLEWAIVDIVLTEFELVYLDASAPEEMNAGGFNTLMRKRQIRDNIIATNGGMRMRLRDVVVGRKIVGHVDLRLISSVKVLCHLAPLVAEKMTNDDENNRLDFQSEYWTPCKREWNAASANMLNEKRWRRVEENQLKITSPQGELYFRFFCDLESAEQTERGATPSQGLFTEAFAWCQTLAHYSTGIEILRDHAVSSMGGSIDIIDRSGDTNPSKKRWGPIESLSRRISNAKHAACEFGISHAKQVAPCESGMVV